MQPHWQPNLEENFWLSASGATTVAILIVIVLAFVMFLRRRSSKTTATRISIAPEDVRPRCVCGDLATDPGPSLRRTRGDWLRSIFAAPPRYRRTVEALSEPVYCRSHAHLADVLLDQFIYDLRAKQAAQNAAIASSAANFEQEGLRKLIVDSLTDDQKRAARKAAPVRLVANDG